MIMRKLFLTLIYAKGFLINEKCRFRHILEYAGYAFNEQRENFKLYRLLAVRRAAVFRLWRRYLLYAEYT